MGKLYSADRKFKRAEEYFLEALSILEPHVETMKETLSLVHGHLVMVYENRGEGDKSTAHLVAMGRLFPDQDSENPRPIYRPNLVMPERAIRSHKEGYVLVEFTVTSEGQVRDPVIVEADPEGYFEETVLEFIAKARYAPRIMNGEPIDASGLRNIITFEIEK